MASSGDARTNNEADALGVFKGDEDPRNLPKAAQSGSERIRERLGK